MPFRDTSNCRIGWLFCWLTNGYHSGEEVHEWEEVDPEDEGVDEVGQGERVEDGEEGGEGEEEGLRVAEDEEDDQAHGHSEVDGVLEQVLVEQGVLQAWKEVDKMCEKRYPIRVEYKSN